MLWSCEVSGPWDYISYAVYPSKQSTPIHTCSEKRFVVLPNHECFPVNNTATIIGRNNILD